MRAAFGLVVVLGLLCSCTAPQATPEREPALRWSAPLDRDHVLVGRIWEVAARRFVSEAELAAALARSSSVVLGEKHDNPDHHRLQARLIEQLTARGRRPALVFEMLDLGVQAALDQSRAQHPSDVDALARAVRWQDSGWPPWALYRPVFAAALEAQLPIVAAGLNRGAAMDIARRGAAALDPELTRRFALDAALPAAQEAELRAEMRDAHCGMLPESMLGSMVLVQRARDAQFADKLHAAAAGADGALLIAGNGHARRDRGVPAQLARALGTSALAIGLLEVQPGLLEPAQYRDQLGGDALPFDYVWFTPRTDDDDPCAELRARLKK
jgi:uncharacterized iron-regulated protein